MQRQYCNIDDIRMYASCVVKISNKHWYAGYDNKRCLEGGLCNSCSFVSVGKCEI